GLVAARGLGWPFGRGGFAGGGLVAARGLGWPFGRGGFAAVGLADAGLAGADLARAFTPAHAFSPALGFAVGFVHPDPRSTRNRTYHLIINTQGESGMAGSRPDRSPADLAAASAHGAAGGNAHAIVRRPRYRRQRLAGARRLQR